MARLLLFFVRVYQAFFSALMPSACKFYPSCSHYAAEALRMHGARHGTWLALKRLSRCHPFTRGGVDLVPEREDAPAVTAQQNAHGNVDHAGSPLSRHDGSVEAFAAATLTASFAGDCHSERSEESLLLSARRAESALASHRRETSPREHDFTDREYFPRLDFPIDVASREESRQAEACPTGEVSS